jgi:transposase
MAKRIPVPKDWAETLPPLLKSARTATDLRHVLCIWMRLALGMSAANIAVALGWSARTVRQVQERFLREGKAAFQSPGKGGRRNELMSRQAEYALLRRLREENFPNAALEFRAVHQAVEKAVGREVPLSTVHRLLKRHGWHRTAHVLIPQNHDPSVPVRRQRGPRTGAWSLLRPETTESPAGSPANTAH